MEPLVKGIAVLSASVFALWALYISLVEHPARMRIEPGAGLAEFRQSYRLAAPWQASTAGIAFVFGALTWLLTSEWLWLVGGLAVGLAIPFTLLVVMPTNRGLLETMPTEAEITVLLTRWGRLHWVRSLLGLVSLIVLWSRLRVP